MMAPLFIKTHNSLLKSIIKIDELISFAQNNNLKCLGLTDNSMYGVMEFYHACLKANIKPIIGLDLTNVILFAKNYNGYKNLIKLSTIASKEEITIDILKEYASDLVCVVPFSNHHNYNDLCFYEDIFQGYQDMEEKQQLEGDNLIYANEILYLEESEQDYLKYVYALNQGVSLKDFEFNKANNHLLNYQIYPMDLENNDKIVNLCNLEIPFHQDLLPVYTHPNNLDSFTYLKQLVKEGLKNKFGERINKIYLDRLHYELDIINKMGFCNYFLVVWDYVKFAKENNILVGPGRGSAAGSLVSYCLDITTIDPVKYNLFFERFLNPERISMPDIDVDFEYTRREEVVNYCIKKYGLKKVAPIITFGTLGSKQVLRDVGKCLDIDIKIIDRITKLIDSRMSLLDNYQKNPKLKEYINQNKLQKLYKVSLKLEGLKRHTSIHAAGVVISNQNLDEAIPLVYKDGMYLTGYSMEYLEEIGLLKMDFLALRNLTLIHNVLAEIPHLNFDTIPLDDKKALAIFTNVETIGIFQFESSGMMNFLRKFRPNTFEDIVAALALFRPGPMNNIDSYIKRKQGQEAIDYIDEALVSILKPTYGIIVYQEQIMQIASVLAGYSLAEADVLRKAMSKKKESVLLEEKDKFINNSLQRGYSKEVATKVYDLILKFASYGFNRAHSVSYAMISYKMAYLKAHYPLIFMKHLLSLVIGSEIKTKEYLNLCREQIDIIHPDINLSDKDYQIINGQIIYPLTNIKNVGFASGRYIIEERSKGQFKDIFDFFTRCYGKGVNSKVIESLIKAGCFTSLGYNQRTLDENMAVLTNYSELGELLEDSLKPELELYPEYSLQELLNREIDVFGFYLSSHPVSQLRNNIKAIYLKDLTTYFDKTVIALIQVDKIKQITTKHNENMMFITGSDETSSADFVLFPNIYDNEITKDDIYLVKGKVEKRFDKYQIVISKLKKVN